jgi:hypothetical protein
MEVAGFGGAFFAEFEVEVFEDVEHLDDGGAAGTRWTHGEDGMAAVGAFNWFALDGFVGFEVVEGDGAVVGFHVGGDELGGLALVELFGTVLLEALEGGGEVGLFDDFALFQGRFGAVEEDFGGLREALHDGDLEGEDDLHALGGGEAVFGQEAGGFEDFGPFEFAEFLVGEGEAGDGAGDGGSFVAYALFFGVFVHLRVGGGGGHFFVVDGGGAPVGHADEHVAAAAEVAGFGVDDGEGDGHGDGGVDGVAALFHDVDADLAGEFVGAGDHAVFGAFGLGDEGALGFETEAGLADLLGWGGEGQGEEEQGGAHD